MKVEIDLGPGLELDKNLDNKIFLPQKEDLPLPTKIAGSDLKVLRTCSVIKMKVWTIPA